MIIIIIMMMMRRRRRISNKGCNSNTRRNRSRPVLEKSGVGAKVTSEIENAKLQVINSIQVPGTATDK